MAGCDSTDPEYGVTLIDWQPEAAARELDHLMDVYVQLHPFEQVKSDPPLHPAVTALRIGESSWLVDQMGGLVPYWSCLVAACRAWPEDDLASRIVRSRLFAAMGMGEDRFPELPSIYRELDRWRRSRGWA